MALPTGLVPVFVFALTVGVAGTAAVVAHLFYQTGNGTFASALRDALLVTGGVYLVGVGVVWAIAGGPLWGVPAALVGAGLVALVVSVGLPLAVGQQVVQRTSDADPETALRCATYGWPVAMLVVFGVFVAPGGVVGGDLLDLDGARTCLLGFCGIAIPFAAAVVLELLLAVLGPGIVGVGLYVSRTGGSRTDAR